MEQELDAVFTFPDGSQHPAYVKRRTDRIGNYEFWYGVASFATIPTNYPQGAIGGSVRFDDGREDGVTFPAGSAMAGVTFEASFVGIAALSPKPEESKVNMATKSVGV